MNMIFAIATGGALGALMRHGLNTGIGHLTGPGFPWGILAVNILGSFILGLFTASFAHFWEPSQAMRAFLTVGLMGAFTTFSTFSMETVLLIERSAYGAAAFYIIASVSLAVAGFMGGMMLIRSFVS